MDVLTDTEMPDRCTDAPQILPDIQGVQMPPQVPMTFGEHIVQGDIQIYREGVRHTDIWGCPDIWGHPNVQGDYGHVGAYRCPLCLQPPHACH